MSLNAEDFYPSTGFQDTLTASIPEKEVGKLSGASYMMETRREVIELDQALAAQKEEFQMKMESLKQRQTELEHKERKLKESLQKFNKFLKENDIKKNRAYNKANIEYEQRRIKEDELERLSKENETVATKRNTVVESVEKNHIYLSFLESICESAEEFSERSEIIARYSTLVATYQDLINQNQDNQEAMESSKRDLMQFSVRKYNEILHCNNTLAILQTRLDNLRSESAKLESKWEHIKNTAAQKTMLVGLIKMSALNLCSAVAKGQDTWQPKVDVDDFYGQLSKVEHYIEDLRHIVKETNPYLQ